MWIAKLKLRHDDCPITTRCKKYQVVVGGYPINWYSQNNKRYASFTCFFQNFDESKKKQFIDDLRKDKRGMQLDIVGDIFTYEIDLDKKGEHVMLYLSKKTFLVSPILAHTDGHEYWQVASWEREELTKFINLLKKQMDFCQIMSFKESPLNDIYFPNIMPRLSEKQKQAIELACEQGYYSYPRKTSLEKLSKIARVGVSTFQEHLRKAEVKLIPKLVNKDISPEISG